MNHDEARRFLDAFRADPPVIPEGQAAVLLLVGDDAELVTALHPYDAPLTIPAERITQQAGLPAKELPGRMFTVDHLTETEADGFRLLNDPRL